MPPFKLLVDTSLSAVSARKRTLACVAKPPRIASSRTIDIGYCHNQKCNIVTLKWNCPRINLDAYLQALFGCLWFYARCCSVRLWQPAMCMKKSLMHHLIQNVQFARILRRMTILMCQIPSKRRPWFIQVYGFRQLQLGNFLPQNWKKKRGARPIPDVSL